MKKILFLTLSVLSFHAFAGDKYVCTHANMERFIEVIYASPDSKVPCKVKYTKPDEVKILWRANNEMGYCESKAEEFAKKQESFGWSCSVVSE